MRHDPEGLPASRAAKLGSARRGLDAWRAERLTAIALVPLTLWLVASLTSIGAADLSTFRAWLGRPLQAFLVILTLMIAFRHTALGLRVVIEDYVHSALKIPLLITADCTCFAAGAAGVLATLSVALGP